MTLISLIEARIREQLAPVHLEVIDDSHRHAGHEGAHGGGRHFQALIVSESFRGMSLLEQHRRVYGLFQEEMKKQIHALVLRTMTPEQWHGPRS